MGSCVVIRLSLSGGSEGGGAKPLVVVIGKQNSHNHFGDFLPVGLLVQVLCRECTIVIVFVLFGACEQVYLGAY